MKNTNNAAKLIGPLKLAATAAVVVLFAFSLLFVGIRIAGLTTFVVTGGSMEPTVHKGSLVIDEAVASSALKLGDEITFEKYGQMVTHRVVGIDGTPDALLFTTKGDANAVADPEPVAFPGQVGRVKLAVPAIGFVVAWLQFVWRMGATVVAALIFFACAALTLLRRDRPAQTRPAIASARMAAPVQLRRAKQASEADAVWAEHLRWLGANGQTGQNVRAA